MSIGYLRPTIGLDRVAHGDVVLCRVSQIYYELLLMIIVFLRPQWYSAV